MADENKNKPGESGGAGSNLADKFIPGVSEGKPGRGRPPKNPAPKGPDKSEIIAELFTPEQFISISTLPFDLAQAATGWDGWELDEKEERLLATSAAATAREFLKGASFDPKWVILSMFALNLGKLIASRAIAYKTYKRDMAKPDDRKAS